MMVKMGFAEKWLRWMKACIFNSSMSVLVNRSPTEDLSCKRFTARRPLVSFLVFDCSRRYGSMSSLLSWEAITTSNKDSLWWRDVTGVGRKGDDCWFPLNVCSILGNGESIRFWKQKWFGAAPLRNLFPNLFDKELYKDCVVSDLVHNGSLALQWNSDWMNTLTHAEFDEKVELEQLLVGLNLYADREDRSRWVFNASGLFSVKSAYIFLQSRLDLINLDLNVIMVLNKVWKNDVPSKVGVFGWRLLFEKFPTRANLASKEVWKQVLGFIVGGGGTQHE
ncbi:hypothetical protein TSUD_409160 [Trifolium subterraneum]|uniref:Reverse transcriptase zinc-binding domain-containing protein n=1 Tax=Trifolium subterraneum TaxID=3900 RepID=A0A2Z6PGX5_TRISU|nr:hypothetical protein TSUD_409160 [Trifolium subterraneum]